LEPAIAPAEAPKPPAWNPARGAIFSLGLFVAAAALFYSGVQGYFFRISQRTQDPAAIQLGIENEHIDHLSHVDAMSLFRQEEKEGLGQPTPPYWTEIDKLHEASGRKAILGLIVAGVGLLATAGSMVGRPKRA
jgi:hypothetical protein